jgi:hypothetical protein
MLNVVVLSVVAPQMKLPRASGETGIFFEKTFGFFNQESLTEGEG